MKITAPWQGMILVNEDISSSDDQQLTACLECSVDLALEFWICFSVLTH